MRHLKPNKKVLTVKQPHFKGEKTYVEGIGIFRLDKETGLPEYKNVTDKWNDYYDAFAKLVLF